MINDLNAAIPLRSAQTEVQNTIGQRQQQQTQSHLETSVALRAQFETDSTAKRRRPKPSRKRANFSPQRNLRLPEKTMFGANPNISNRILMSLFQRESKQQ